MLRILDEKLIYSKSINMSGEYQKARRIRHKVRFGPQRTLKATTSSSTAILEKMRK